MQTIIQQRVSRALGFLLAALIVVPAQLTGSPAGATVNGAPGPIPSVRYDGNGPRSVALSWDAPRGPGSSPVTDYVIEYRGAGGSWTVFDDGISTVRSATVTGLEARRDYELRVAAVNANGTGPASVLGIGEEFVSNQFGTCAADPSGRFNCVDGTQVYQSGTDIDDPNRILPSVRVTDVTKRVGYAQRWYIDLSCVLSKSRGVVCISGSNEQGQQGLGYAGMPAGNFVVEGLPENIVDISVSGNTGCALSDSKEVWCWGRWSNDRFGKHLLTPALQLRGAKDLDGLCAIQWDDTITCLTAGAISYRWASNPAAPTARQLDAHSGGVCALTMQNSVICFDNIGVAFSTIAGLTDVVEIQAYPGHWCAVIMDGTVKCGGSNDVGQLGDGSFSSGTTTARLPEPIVRLAENDDEVGGIKRSCAIGVSATVYCWGNIGDLRLGVSSTTVPKIVPAFGPWTVRSAAAPATVTNLTQTSRSARTVTVSWATPHAGDFALSGYSLEWRLVDGTWATVPIAAGVNSWTSPELAVQSTVEVRVAATSVAGTGPTSEVLTASTALPPQRPSTPTISASTASSVTVTWRPVSSPHEPVLNYQLDWSTDRTTWSSRTVSAGETSAILTGLSVGSAVAIRLSAVNAAGTSSFSETVTAYTTGLVSHTIAVRDADGQPVYGGQVTWRKRDGSFESALDYGLTVDGRATFPFIPAGPVDVTLRDVQLLGGAIANYEATTTIGFSTDSVITLPPEPSQSTHTVRVALPNGLPVVGATVSVTDLSSSASVDGALFTSPETVTGGVTNEYGEVYLSGYSSDESRVLVEYNDGILIQRASGPLGDGDAEFVLEDMPWVETPVITTEPVAGSLVTLTLKTSGSVSADGRSTHSAVGATVSIAPPAGAAQKCKGARLSATVGANGIATLTVCATKSGRYLIRGAGVVSTGAVSLQVKGAAPLPVVNARAVSPSHGNVTVSWSAPSYSGGNPVTKYTVTLKKGKKTLTKTVTGTSALFTKMPGATKWTVTVIATSKFGSSEPSRMVVPVS
jgi:hypothetical protein